MNSEEFKKHLADLKDIAYQQKVISQKSGIDKQKKDLTTISELLGSIETQLANDKLNVLVMGKFSSGKSTFLNALMGRKLLPAKAKPTTAIIGEITYSETPGATLYPKKTGTKPQDISIDELEKYVTIETMENEKDEKDPPRKESLYSKVEIRYPLSICEKGIKLVDSPGLDDPTSHDDITTDYLPKADTIIYCMNAQQPFSMKDKTVIESLNGMGYKSIIFVLTYFDTVEYSDEMAGTNNADDIKVTYTRLLKHYTDLGNDGIFFVGSLPALTGKEKNNQVLLEKSHFIPLETKLENVLFNQKGRLKLAKAYSTIKRVNIDTRRFIADSIDLATADQTQIGNKLNDAQEKLNIAQKRASLISQNFDAGAKSVVDDSEDKARAFINQELLPNIKTWIMEAETQTSITVWHPKESAKQFSEECLDHLKVKIEGVTGNWLNNEFTPNFLRPRIEALANEQQVNINTLEEDLKSIRADLSLSPIEIEDETPSTGGRVGSSIVGLLTGGVAGGVAGALVGPESIIPGIVAQVTGAIVLYIISLFTPVGWVAAIVTVVVASIVGGVWGWSNVGEKAKKKIAEQAREGIQNSSEDIIDGITSKVQEIVDTISKIIKDSFNEPISEYRALVDKAQQNADSDSVTLKKHIDDLKALRDSNNKVEEDLNIFGHVLIA